MAVTNYDTYNGRIFSESTSGVQIDYLHDALGSVIATVDQTATVVNTYRYKPYGDLLAKTGAAADPKFLWVGGWGYRNTTNVWAEKYVRARHYGVRQAGWTTVDRLWPRQSSFGYLDSRPTFTSDPSGLGWSVLGIPVGSIVTGCVLNGGFNAILDWLTNAPQDYGKCNAGAGCLAGILGAIAGALSEEGGPIVAGCIAGLVSSIATAIGGQVCGRINNCASRTNSPLCDALGILGGSVLGCVGGVIGGTVGTKDVRVIISTILGTLLGGGVQSGVAAGCEFQQA